MACSKFIGSSSVMFGCKLHTYGHQNYQRLQMLPFYPISRKPLLSSGCMRRGQHRRELVIYGSIIPPPSGPPLPSGSPSNSWKGWLVGMVFTIILPFFTHKWGPLLQLKNNIDTVVETAEHIIDAIEVVAEKVDKVAENIADDLPEGGKLRKAVDFIEDVAEEIAKDAHLASDLIDKVEEAEDKLESLIEPLISEEAKSKDSDASDYKET